MNVGLCDDETYAHKLDVLRDHCEQVGREYETITKTYFGFISISQKGREPDRRDDLHIIYGTPEEVTQELNLFVELGVQHFMLRFLDFPSTEGLELFIQEVVPNL
jgi:alkanesulfonate monooxygenase